MIDLFIARENLYLATGRFGGGNRIPQSSTLRRQKSLALSLAYQKCDTHPQWVGHQAGGSPSSKYRNGLSVKNLVPMVRNMRGVD